MAADRIAATVIHGDGIGPEIVGATLRVLKAVGAQFDRDKHPAGLCALERHGDALPVRTIESIRRTRLALKGPLATPVGGGMRSINVRLREQFQPYANLRPSCTFVQGGRFENIRPRRGPD
jgi:isocitrate dehydrogenase (NAD+)